MAYKSRNVYMISGGLTKFRKYNYDEDFRLNVKNAVDYALRDIKMDIGDIDGSVSAYFSDHFLGQLIAGAMTNDYIGMSGKPSKRIEGGGATGGLAFQTAYEEIASGNMETCLVYGFENMSHVNTWRGNDLIALGSDSNFDYPLGGFYTAYYALMATRHMHEFGTTERQMALVSVKNHNNALHNPFAQAPMKINVDDVLNSPVVSTPLKMLDICLMSDGAAAAILASEDAAKSFSDKPVLIKSIGASSDTMRLADRTFGDVPLLPNETKNDYKNLKYPGVHSFKAGRLAAKMAYERAGIKNPEKEVDFAELYDAYTSAEIQAYEDMGFCRYGDGGKFIEEGRPNIDGDIPVNMEGGLQASGHAIGATGIMQAVYAFWQLQGNISRHFGNNNLQVKNHNTGIIHSHAGTGAYETVTVMEAV
ncbi:MULTISPECIES: thiolase domain-containing protein [Acidiplasma]|jgi:acetyl-CoA C-acetyltransferase|uniref:Acetyl-CoA acetyltransferase n=1 Tax=Acidiplasma aeolicum TaxID=507754 RepID=A0A0Q0RFR5_9ARCH|nr:MULTISPECIES: thiolase domain-containing protein [Acidiplasma]KJE48727.1 acetyl-CoA acetyltransferase [Acidiplasma sp. MBA-1]KPV47608.1 acetyl-CoA acetyltransferase [Acidiplasma aeolicum]KQB33929.1 acetyl-CoA acetyltransferase [Acidiplasma aeolicum]WMT55376.1 MAG: thiolase domain-containing protein [Acidiplasma sp.]